MRKTLLTVRLLLGLAFFGTLFCTLFCTLLQVGSVSAEEAGSLSEANDPLIVHEWGTWTSFSGSNGVQLEFRPLHDAGLPMFVLDRSDFNPTGKPRSSLAKSATVARYRMETPVTYFYTDRKSVV